MLISEEEYLHTPYEHYPDFEDGVVVERGIPTKKHSRMQARLAAYFNRRGKVWKLEAYTELHFRIRAGKYMLPDVAVVPDPQSEDPYGTEPPLIWIEVLSPDDRLIRVNQKIADALAYGTSFVWVIDPETMESELHTPQGRRRLDDGILRIPGTPIEVALSDVLED